jgi:5'-3' exonuclease
MPNNIIETPSVTGRPYLFVDGLNCFIRNFMVNEEVNATGEPIGGVTGFLKSLNSYIGTFAPSKVFVIWENGGPSPRRKKIAPYYKEHRARLKEFNKNKPNGTMKDILRSDDSVRINQLITLTKLLKNTPVHQIFVKEVECDDVIAYLVKDRFAVETVKKVIVSSDKDFWQLLQDPLVQVFDTTTKTIITPDKVEQKFGVSARNFALAKTIAGDSSDNLPGVPGAGFKTVAKRFPLLLERSRDVTVSEVVSYAKEKALEKKAPKVYGDVAQCENLLNTNWDLMYLNISNLSASQIEKINYAVDSHEAKMDKLGLVKTLLGAGISTNIDIESFCTQMRNYLR